MPSNVENILNAILTGDGSGIQKPASRVEELLFEIYEQGGGGGGESVIGGIKLTIDSDYVMTATLVDKDGEEYGVSDDIDLPLEEMVVDAEYDPQTQKIKLELKNGNYVEFSVAELVSGLQAELSSDNKLNPAYIAYDSSHRAVSDTEKNTWNAKQNAISDLEAIRSGAAAGATAVQPATMSEALAAKQNSLSTAQLAAVNSGIDSTKVSQIETNKANILYGLNAGVKNLIRLVPGTFTNNVATFDVSNDGVVTVNSTSAGVSAISNSYFTLPAGTYRQEQISFGGGDVRLTNVTTNTRITGSPFTLSSDTLIRVDIYSYALNTNVIVKPMVCTEEAWNQSHDYQPPALPNYDLTRLEAEDREVLAEVVDSGAKNLLQLPSGSATSYGITFSCDPNTGIVTANGTRQSGDCFMLLANISLTSFPRKFVAFCNNTDNTKVCITIIPHRTNGTYGSTIAIGTYAEIDLTNSAYDSFLIRAVSYADTGTTLNNEKIYPMLCTKAVFDVSQKFAPYRPSYDTIASTYLTKCNTAVVNSGSLDDVSTNTIAYYSNNVSGLPSGVSGYAICETTVFDANVMVQKLYMIDGVYNAFIRMKQTGTWRAWKQITNT